MFHSRCLMLGEQWLEILQDISYLTLFYWSQSVPGFIHREVIIISLIRKHPLDWIMCAYAGSYLRLWIIVLFDPIDCPSAPLPKSGMIEATNPAFPRSWWGRSSQQALPVGACGPWGLKCNSKPPVQHLGGRHAVSGGLFPSCRPSRQFWITQ